MAKVEPVLFNTLLQNSTKIKKAILSTSTGISQKEILVNAIKFSNTSAPDFLNAIDKMLEQFNKGDITSGLQIIKRVIPNQAAFKRTAKGLAVMAEGWEKPIVFPYTKGFKMLDWADDTSKLTTEGLWTMAYGKKPALTMGIIGNSNIKPEQVLGGCSLSKKELSEKYESAIQEFYNTIFSYLKECGAKPKDIGLAFAHSDSGVDRAARKIVENNSIKGFAITPTEYTKYIRGVEMQPDKYFPNGYILADFPFPSILTRNIDQIEDYVTVYSKMTGVGMPLGVFNGGEHAFCKDMRKALVQKGGSVVVPSDIMRDKFNITIPATDKNGTILNAARNMLDEINGSPYEQYKYAFKNYLPSTKLKSDIAQYDPQASIATIAYTKLKLAGKI